MPVARLTVHTSTPATPVRALTVDVGRSGEGALTLTFRLDGRIDDVKVPAPRPPERLDGLWRHTCFEAFIGRDDDDPGYREINLAPSGAWAVYDFRAYRDARPSPAVPVPPRIVAEATAERLALDATVALPAPFVGAPLRLALATVVEASDGTLSYWALRHPPGAPDFHHADGFAFHLA